MTEIPETPSSVVRLRLFLRSLLAKMLAIFLVALIAQAVGAYLILKYAFDRTVTSEIVHTARNTAHLHQQSTQYFLVNKDFVALTHHLYSAVNSTYATDAVALDCAGRVYAAGDRSQMGKTLPDLLADLPTDFYKESLRRDTIVVAPAEKSGVYYSFSPIPCPSLDLDGWGPKYGGGLLLRSDFTPLMYSHGELYIRLGIAQLVLSGLALMIGSILFYGHVATKLKKVSVGMKSFSSDKPHFRYRSDGKDEIDRIGQSFNNMANTIQKQFIRIQNTNRRLLLTDKVFELTSVGVVILDDKLIVIDVNPAFIEINDRQLHDVVGKPFGYLHYGLSDKENVDFVEEANKSNSAFRENWVRSATGKRFRKAFTLSPMRNEEGLITHYFVIEEDVTDDYIQKMQMHTIATTDALTGLKNRRQFESDSSGLKLTEAGCCAIALIDLDGLKDINTKYGHLAGDHLIEVASRRIEEQVRHSSVGLYRLGGDEFCVILKDVGTQQDLTRICRTLTTAVEGPIELGLVNTNLTIGMGVTLYDPERHESVQDLIIEADISLKSAKLLGRSSFVVASTQVLSAHERKTNVSLALKSPSLEEEVQLAYLPKVDIQNNILSGAEALIRWTSPDLGFVLNDEFIPIAEETGDILRIDNWVMQRAISDAVLFEDLIHGFQTTINVSPRQLFESFFADELVRQLESHKVDPENFSVEITEWSAIQNHERFIPILDSLRASGVSVELDDFGTGHSPLVNLHKLPVDALKVDRSFVGNMLSNRVSMEIVRSIILLGHSLKMTVIAEGVENISQLRLLRELGCDYCQGYLYSEPVIVDSKEGLQTAIEQWESAIQTLS